MPQRDATRFCGSPLHAVSRRSFLSALAAGTAAAVADMRVLDVLQSPVLAQELKKQQKRVILLWLAGGASQLETFDPKPGRPTGGPYRAIPTSVPGVHISELMPNLAQRMKHVCILRSLNTRVADHGGGAGLMETGRAPEPGLIYPDLGAMVAAELGRADSQVPDYVSMYTSTEGRRKGTSGFLGARYAPMFLTDSMIPPNIRRPEQIDEVDHRLRADLRTLLSRRFQQGRESSAAQSHSGAFARVHGLMSSERLFDIEQEPQSMRDRYGPTQFAEQALIARRLIEAGVPFVKVARAWWDSHGQNFETHLELVTELDHVMSTLIDDLNERGLLEHTMILTLSEFGRTPNINPSLGRDHFASAWSVSITGCGIQGGACYGKSDEDGHRVADGEIKAGDLFATIFEALGIPHDKEYYLGSRPVPLTDPGSKPVREVLA